VRVICVDASHKAQWDGYAVGHSGGAPYHAFAWLEAVHGAYGFTPAPLMAVRHGHVAGVLPLTRFRALGGRGRLVSVPYCDFGGPLADDGDVAARLVEEALRLAGHERLAGVEVRRLAPEAEYSAKVVMRRDLPQGGDGEQRAAHLFRSFPSKLRSQARKPLRDGLSVRAGGIGLLPDFYRVFTRNMRDLGSPAHSLEWFCRVVTGFGENARVTVVSGPSGEPLAAAVLLVHGGRAFVPWASSLKEYNRQNPNMLLYWDMLSFACRMGLAQFDFGRSTVGGGTYRFKRQWGARELGLSWESWSAAGGRATERLGSSGPGNGWIGALARGVWRGLPLGAANWAGPRIRRSISL